MCFDAAVAVVAALAAAAAAAAAQNMWVQSVCIFSQEQRPRRLELWVQQMPLQQSTSQTKLRTAHYLLPQLFVGNAAEPPAVYVASTPAMRTTSYAQQCHG
jgi:hypothetical protein